MKRQRKVNFMYLQIKYRFVHKCILKLLHLFNFSGFIGDYIFGRFAKCSIRSL